ncbi:protein transport protein HofB [Salmonella enterica subsp. indica]|uniref:Protein transport protein HofB n=1 Tax=Salmonella enterica subsp. indica TaxID=59207 RepID=A0A379XUB6_SALER|nr:protein transport protein HofB [Salmonella enterica subsp. indica]
MKDAQLNTLCQRHQAVLINSASNSITVAVVDAPSHALLDALHFATQKQIDIVCWTRQQMESHLHKPEQAPLGKRRERRRNRGPASQSGITLGDDETRL